MAASPANSGPIIAELIDELEENGNGGGIAGFGGINILANIYSFKVVK